MGSQDKKHVSWQVGCLLTAVLLGPVLLYAIWVLGFIYVKCFTP